MPEEKSYRIKQELLELANRDIDEFLKLTGLDLNNFEICKRKKNGQSIRQIAINTGLGRGKVEKTICKVCP